MIILTWFITLLLCYGVTDAAPMPKLRVPKPAVVKPSVKPSLSKETAALVTGALVGAGTVGVVDRAAQPVNTAIAKTNWLGYILAVLFLTGIAWIWIQFIRSFYCRC
ncbi:hypothetical protein FACS18942_01810 [Planctomycetales bacterium]|nr:hypothetical protein FACS18942_01810 [Planctomycetales bacterium]